MRLTLTTFLTLDGVMQSPGQPTEDQSGGFEHGGWQVPYGNDDSSHIIQDWFESADAFLLGRRTYDIFASHWPRVSDDPIADQLNDSPKYVVSMTLDSLEWRNSTLIKENVINEIVKLKSIPGNELQVWGSGQLARTLMANDLIDEYRLLTYPITLGTGRRLFTNPPAAALRLVDAKTTNSGVIVAIYHPAGKPTYGSYGLD